MTAFDGQSDKVGVYFDSRDTDGIMVGIRDDAWVEITPEEAFEVAVDLLTAVQARGRDDLVEGLIVEQASMRWYSL